MFFKMNTNNHTHFGISDFQTLQYGICSICSSLSYFWKPEVSLIVPDFTISVYGSYIICYFFSLISLLLLFFRLIFYSLSFFYFLFLFLFLFLFNFLFSFSWHPCLPCGCNLQERERKGRRQKKRQELPYTEMAKSATNRLAARLTVFSYN